MTERIPVACHHCGRMNSRCPSHVGRGRTFCNRECRRRYFAQRRADALKMRTAGLSVTRTAKALGLSRERVYQYARARGR